MPLPQAFSDRSGVVDINIWNYGKTPATSTKKLRYDSPQMVEPTSIDGDNRAYVQMRAFSVRWRRLKIIESRTVTKEEDADWMDPHVDTVPLFQFTDELHVPRDFLPLRTCMYR